ncbi:MAG: preprotein translocase subunit SecA, partial [Caldilineaceae bacterium]
MLKKLYYAVAGDPNEKVLKRFRPVVVQVNDLEPTFEKKSNDELRAMTEGFRTRIAEATTTLRTELDEANKEYMAVLGTDEQKYARVEVDRLKKALLAAEADILEEILPEAFAAVREASKRTIGLRHYDVQLIGGMVLHSGTIAEMKTGEGKTLVATLPLYLNALVGRGVHLVTPNDYLSKVGLQLMGPVYQLLGLTAAVIQNSAGNPDSGSFVYDPEFPAADDRFLALRPTTRKEAYAADVTYGTNNEFGFDYLRDNMKYEIAQMSQRGHHFAIVDEVDSILVDEARTPLIISGPLDDKSDLYAAIDKLIPRLEKGDYEVDEKQRQVALTESGNERIEELLREAGLIADGDLYESANVITVHHVNQALRAHGLFQ